MGAVARGESGHWRHRVCYALGLARVPLPSLILVIRDSAVGLRSGASMTGSVAPRVTSVCWTWRVILRGAAERGSLSVCSFGFGMRGTDLTLRTLLATPLTGTTVRSRTRPAADGLEVADWCNCALGMWPVD